MRFICWLEALHQGRLLPVPPWPLILYILLYRNLRLAVCLSCLVHGALRELELHSDNYYSQCFLGETARLARTDLPTHLM